MNIFVLDLNIITNVHYHCDKHVVKQCLESAQMLCTAIRCTSGVDYDWLYKPTHINHPCSIWARETLGNFWWLCEFGLKLCDEYTFRYGRVYKCRDIIINCSSAVYVTSIKNLEQTPFTQAMPDEYKDDDIVTAYRQYFIGEKQHLANWTKRPVPYWFFNTAQCPRIGVNHFNGGKK